MDVSGVFQLFSPYIQLSIGLNFTYAASNQFKRMLKQDLLEPIQLKISCENNRCIQLKKEITNSSDIDSDLVEDYRVRIEEAIGRFKNNNEFNDYIIKSQLALESKVTPIHLFFGVSGIFILIIGSIMEFLKMYFFSGIISYLVLIGIVCFCYIKNVKKCKVDEKFVRWGGLDAVKSAAILFGISCFIGFVRFMLPEVIELDLNFTLYLASIVLIMIVLLSPFLMSTLFFKAINNKAKEEYKEKITPTIDEINVIESDFKKLKAAQTFGAIKKAEAAERNAKRKVDEKDIS
jgi:hypothetical protein